MKIQDLELVHSRLATLEKLRLPRFAASLKRLCLRQNFITKLDPDIFGTLTNLEELDLYDNQLKTVGGALDRLTNLTYAGRFREML
jgi:protein phosphatase 1 regulatory subunit 7